MANKQKISFKIRLDYFPDTGTCKLYVIKYVSGSGIKKIKSYAASPISTWIDMPNSCLIPTLELNNVQQSLDMTEIMDKPGSTSVSVSTKHV